MSETVIHIEGLANATALASASAILRCAMCCHVR